METRKVKTIPFIATSNNTELHTWFERDRAHVELRHKQSQNTILEFWDEEVGEIVEDGFISPRDWHGSMIEYANELGAKPHA